MRCPECGAKMQKIGNVPIRNVHRFSHRVRLICPVCCVSNKQPFKPLIRITNSSKTVGAA